MLQNVINQIQATPNGSEYAVIRKLGPVEAVKDLQRQLEAFWQGEWPFILEVNNSDPLLWWTKFEHHAHGRVLAVCSILR
jgi:hypothetical protein